MACNLEQSFNIGWIERYVWRIVFIVVITSMRIVDKWVNIVIHVLSCNFTSFFSYPSVNFYLWIHYLTLISVGLMEISSPLSSLDLFFSLYTHRQWHLSLYFESTTSLWIFFFFLIYFHILFNHWIKRFIYRGVCGAWMRSRNYGNQQNEETQLEWSSVASRETYTSSISSISLPNNTNRYRKY